MIRRRTRQEERPDAGRAPEVVPLVHPCEIRYRRRGAFMYVSCACLGPVDYWVSMVHGVEDALAVIHAAADRR